MQQLLWLLMRSAAYAVIICFFIVQLQSYRFIHRTTAPPKAPVGIVLGAGVYENGTVTPILKDRLDKAIELYTNGTIRFILVSGDDGRPDHNEVDPSREYLLAHTIPDTSIYLDHAGFDTYSTMYRAKHIFLVNKAIIITQPFHLPRAVFLARQLGIDASGAEAAQNTYSSVYSIRELFADVKAVIDCFSHRLPRYLGTTIPIPY